MAEYQISIKFKETLLFSLGFKGSSLNSNFSVTYCTYIQNQPFMDGASLLLFLFFFLINFYWSMVALQCCVSLHCTTKESAIHIDILSLLDLPPT